MVPLLECAVGPALNCNCIVGVFAPTAVATCAGSVSLLIAPVLVEIKVLACCCCNALFIELGGSVVALNPTRLFCILLVAPILLLLLLPLLLLLLSNLVGSLIIVTFGSAPLSSACSNSCDC